jgi:polar amino acid transport system permease protein
MKAWDWGGFFDYLVNPYLLQGAIVTLGLTVAAIAGGLVVGCLLSLLRLSNYKWLVLLAKGYIWIFRGTPLLVQLIIIYTGLPQLGIKFTVMESALLGLVLNEAAYLAEIIRAARALGLNSVQTMLYVVLPQAIRIIIPALGNSVNGLLKTTSVTSVISMEELLRKTQILIQEKFLVLELFAVAAIYYLLLTSLWDVIQRRIEARYGRAYKTISISEGH